ncbi:MAG TPA: hypothetical protein VI114_13445, partial [Chthoniobacterales bacterium]
IVKTINVARRYPRPSDSVPYNPVCLGALHGHYNPEFCFSLPTLVGSGRRFMRRAKTRWLEPTGLLS